MPPIDAELSARLAAIRAALRALRIQPSETEFALQQRVAQALAAAAISAQREYPLAPGCRIDFFCEGIGIEVKKGKPARAALSRQIARYAACPQIEALLIVAEHAVPPKAMRAHKPIEILSVQGNWGVALP